MNSAATQFNQFLGKTAEHVRPIPQEQFKSILVWTDTVMLSAEVFEDLERFAQDSMSAGFTIGIASGYRSFDRQLAIWKAKAEGTRQLLSRDEQILDPALLGNTALLKAILHWSALPGTSRHHWGSDFDIYPANLLGDRKLDLTVLECKEMFAEFYAWLTAYLSDGNKAFGRPFYEHDRVPEIKIAEEPWHLSHRETAYRISGSYDLALLRDIWKDCALPLLCEVEKDIANIEANYIRTWAE